LNWFWKEQFHHHVVNFELAVSYTLMHAALGQIVPFSTGRSGATRASAAAQKPGGGDKSSQRALDRAHNDAILAGSSGGGYELTLQLAVPDTKVPPPPSIANRYLQG